MKQKNTFEEKLDRVAFRFLTET